MDELFDDYDEELENLDEKYLIFVVQEEPYAVPVAKVTEIVRLPQVIEVPDVPDFIMGVVNLRGKVIPLMDVRTRFGLAERDHTDRTVVVVLEHEGISTGLIVDAVNEVCEIPETNIDPPPQWQSEGHTKGVIRGLGKHGEDVVVILDSERFLTSKESFAPEVGGAA